MSAKRVYLGLAVVFIGSLVVFVIYREHKYISEVAALPMIGSLALALFQLVRDQAAYERNILKADYQNRFALGASSHMANVAFDKHVQFCEEYVEEAYKALYTLFRQGATPDALTHASNLGDVRRKYAMWLTPKIEADLEVFQAGLRSLGASAAYVRETQGQTRNKHEAKYHMEHIHNMHKKLLQIVGSQEYRDEPLTEELAVTTVVARLREVLGVQTLTELRETIVKRAPSKLGLE